MVEGKSQSTLQTLPRGVLGQIISSDGMKRATRIHRSHKHQAWFERKGRLVIVKAFREVLSGWRFELQLD